MSLKFDFNFNFDNINLGKLTKDANKSGKANLSTGDVDVSSQFNTQSSNKFGGTSSSVTETLDLSTPTRRENPSTIETFSHAETENSPLQPETDWSNLKGNAQEQNAPSNITNENAISANNTNGHTNLSDSFKSSENIETSSLAKNGNHNDLFGESSSQNADRNASSFRNETPHVSQQNNRGELGIDSLSNKNANSAPMNTSNSMSNSNADQFSMYNTGNNPSFGDFANSNMNFNSNDNLFSDSHPRAWNDKNVMYTTVNTNRYNARTETIEDQLQISLEKCGLRESDIARVTRGEITYEQLIEEIQNELSTTRREELMQASYLQAFGLEFNSLENLQTAIDSTRSEISDLQTEKVEYDKQREYDAILNIITRLRLGENLSNVLSTEIVAWKYTDEDGNTQYRYDDPYIGYAMPTDTVYYPLTFEKMYEDSNLIEELKAVLTEETIKPLFSKETKTVYRWDNTTEQENFFSKIISDYGNVASNRVNKIKEIDGKIADLQSQLSSYLYIYDYIVKEISYYIEYVDAYINKDDYSLHNSFDKTNLSKLEEFKRDNKNDTLPDYYDGLPIIKVTSDDDLATLLSCMINGDKTIQSGKYVMIDTVMYQISSKDQLVEHYGEWISFMSEDEKGVFNYILNTSGSKKAIEYLQGISNELDYRWLADKTQKDQEFASEHPVLTSIASIVVTPIEGISAACYSMNSLLTNSPIRRTDVYSSGDVWRGQVAKDIADNHGETLSFVYSTGMSMLDSASMMALTAATGGTAIPALSAVTMGSRAYVSTLNDALDRGLSDGSAIGLAWSSAIVETAMESYSAGHLFNLEGKLGSATTNLVNKVANTIPNQTLATIASKTTYLAAGAISQGLAEGEEEFATEILNFVADEIISGDLSNHTLTINDYISLGNSEEEARKMANKDFTGQLGQAFLGGFVSGVCFGTLGGIRTTHSVSKSIAADINGQFEGTKAQKFAAGIEFSRVQAEIREKLVKEEKKQGRIEFANRLKTEFAKVFTGSENVESISSVDAHPTIKDATTQSIKAEKTVEVDATTTTSNYSEAISKLQGQDIQTIFDFIIENKNDINSFFAEPLIQDFFNEYFDNNAFAFTYQIINNLNVEFITPSMIDMVAALDDEQFEKFVKANDQEAFYENDAILNRAIATEINFMRGLSENMKIKIVENDAFIENIKDSAVEAKGVIRELSPENIDTFLDRIDFDSKSPEDKITIITTASGLTLDTQNRLLNDQQFTEGLKTFAEEENYKFDTFLSLISQENMATLLERMAFSERSFACKIATYDRICEYVDSDVQEAIVRQIGLLDNIDQINSTELSRILRKIKNPTFLFEKLSEPKVYEKLKSEYAYSFFKLMGHLDTEQQIELMRIHDVFSNMSTAGFNEMLRSISLEAAERILTKVPNLKPLITVESCLDLYLKSQKEEYLTSLKEKLDSNNAFMIRDTVVEQHLESLFTVEEYKTLYENATLSIILDALKSTEPGIYQETLSNLLDEEIEANTYWSLADLAGIVDRLNEEQLATIMDSLRPYSLYDLKKTKDKFTEAQIEYLLDRIAPTDFISSLDEDYVYDYFIKRLNENPAFFENSEGNNDAVIYFYDENITARIKEVLSLMRKEDRPLFVSKEMLKDETYKEEMKALIKENPNLIVKVPPFSIEAFLQEFTSEERLALYDELSPDKLTRIFKSDMLEAEKIHVENILLSSFGQLEASDQVSVLKNLNDVDQANFLKRIEELQAYDGYSFSELLKNVKNKDNLALAFRKMFTNESSLDLSNRSIEYLISKMDVGTLKLFSQNCVDEILTKGFARLPTLEFEVEIMKRFATDIGILHTPDVEAVLSQMSSDNRQIISLKFDEIIQNTDFEGINTLIGDATLSQKANFAYAVLDGLVDNDKIAFLTKLKAKNSFVLDTFNYQLFEEDIYALGEKFITKMSKYPTMVDQLVKLRQDNRKFSLFANMISTDTETDFITADSKMAVLLNYLLESDLDETLLTPSTTEEIAVVRNLLLKKIDQFSITDMSGNRIQRTRNLIEVDAGPLDTYYERLGKKCDELLKSASTKEEVQNLIFNKYFSMSYEDATEILRMYGKDFTDIKNQFDDSGIATTFLENIYNILTIDTKNSATNVYEELSTLYTMDEILSMITEIKKAYTRSLKSTLYSPTEIVDYVEYAGKKVPVYGVNGDFQMLIQSTYTNYGGMPMINDNYFDSWNLSSRTSNHGICCSLISNDNMGMAMVQQTGIVIGFNSFSDSQINMMAPYDIYTANDGYVITCARPLLYLPGSEIMNNTRHTHNEFNLERTNLTGEGNFSNIQPDYVVMFEEMSEESKQNAIKASVELDIPLVYINKETLAIEESNKIDNLIKDFSKTGNLGTLKQILISHENNRSGYRVSNPELVTKYFASDKIQKALDYAIDAATTETQLVYIRDFLQIELEKFDITYEATNRANEVDIPISDMISKIDEKLSSLKPVKFANEQKLYYKVFQGLSLQEQLDYVENANSDQLAVTIYKLPDSSVELMEKIREKIIQNQDVYLLGKGIMDRNLQVDEFISSHPDMLTSLSDDSLIHLLYTKDDVNVLNEVYRRIDSGSIVFDRLSFEDNVMGLSNRDTVSAYSKLSSEYQGKVRNMIIENFKKMPNNILRMSNYIGDHVENGIFAQGYLFKSYLDGKIDQQGLELLERMFAENPNKIIDINYDLLSKDYIDTLGEDFLKMVINSPEHSAKLVSLRKNCPKVYEAFIKNLSKFDQDNSLYTFKPKSIITLKFFFENGTTLNTLDTETLTSDALLDYILYEDTVSYKSSAIKLNEFSIDYVEKFGRLCDAKFNESYNSETGTERLRDLKNAYFSKYFSMDYKTAQDFITKYNTSIKTIAAIDGESATLVEYLAYIESIDDAEVLKNIYDTETFRISPEELLHLDNALREAYAKTYVDALHETSQNLNSQAPSRIVECDGKQIKIIKAPDQFSLIVRSSDSGLVVNSQNLVDNSYIKSWSIKDTPTSHILASSYISETNIGACPVVGSGVLYAMTDVDSSKIVMMGPSDIDSNITSLAYTSGQTQKFIAAHEMANYTNRIYNEVDLEAEGVKPDYVIIYSDFTESQLENAYKAASEWNIPVIEIDKNELALKQARVIENKLAEFAKTKNLNTLREAVNLYESNTSGYKLNSYIKRGNEDRTASIDNSSIRDQQIFKPEVIENSIKNYIEYLSTLQDNNSQIDSLIDILKDIKSRYYFNNEQMENFVLANTSSTLDLDGLIESAERIKR